MSDLGVEGQQKLKNASVLVVGAGGLGCPVLLYLAAAGVGKIGVIDSDLVEESNLHRQILFSEKDIGKPKAEVASEVLQKQNPEVKVRAYDARLGIDNAMEVISEYDVVVDGSDNFLTRYLVNDACVIAQKTLVYGAVHQFEGQVSVFNHLHADDRRGPNYRDLFPDPPKAGQFPNCREAGIIGIVPGIIGLLQANEVIKIILNWEGVLSGRLLIYDMRLSESRTIKISKYEGKDRYLFEKLELINDGSHCQTDVVMEISPEDFDKLKMSKKQVLVIDVRTEQEVMMQPFMGINYPLADLNRFIEKIPHDIPVVFVCQSGMRSLQAVNYLRSKGEYSNIRSLAGGVSAYSKK